MKADTLHHLRTWIETIEGASDREALQLLFLGGVVAYADPTLLHEAIERLTDADVKKKREAWMKKYRPGAGRHELVADDAAAAVAELEDIEDEYHEATAEAAYLLGIAMGRRLGPQAFVLPKGGAR